MNDPLMNLKNSMKKSVFKDLSFSDARKKAVRESIRGEQSHTHPQIWSEETVLAVLESIQHEAKHGYDISTLLFQKNDVSFQKNEGQLHSLLHLLENKNILYSKWIDEKKYYSLTAKGKKRLVAYKRNDSKLESYLKHLLEEASL